MEKLGPPGVPGGPCSTTRGPTKGPAFNVTVTVTVTVTDVVIHITYQPLT